MLVPRKTAFLPPELGPDDATHLRLRDLRIDMLGLPFDVSHIAVRRDLFVRLLELSLEATKPRIITNA
jgi:hypothetical protein